MEEKGEGRKGKGRKGRGGKTRWREGLGPPKNSVVALPMPDPYSWRGEGNGEERNRKGEEGQEGGKVKGKLEQGRRLAKAGPVNNFLTKSMAN